MSGCGNCRLRRVVTTVNVAAGIYLGLHIMGSVATSLRMRDGLDVAKRFVDTSKRFNVAVTQAVERRKASSEGKQGLQSKSNN